MKKIILSFFLITVYYFSTAQDTHYWTNQFGTRSVMMGGAVVGGKADNSMIYYNPAGLAFLDSSSVSISANLYQAENFSFKNTLGNNSDMNSLQLTAVPLLIAGQFKVSNEKLRVGYGIFSPVTFQYRGGARIAGSFPVVGDTESPGNEVFSGDQSIFSRLRELVLSAGIGYQLSNNWAIGVTGLIDVRTHIYNKASFARYNLNNTGSTLVSSSIMQSFNYYHARLMPKIGIAFRSAGWSFGATATVPGIRIAGKGSLALDAVGTNIKLDASNRGNVFFNNREDKVDSYFESPFSASFGVQYQNKGTSVALTTEYFAEVAQYDIMKGQTTGSAQPTGFYSALSNSMRVRTAALPVWNFAIGLEQAVNEKMFISAGFRNNKSYYDETLHTEPGIVADLTSWDIYHAVAGITRKRERSSISFGITTAFGTDKERRLAATIAIPQENALLQGTSIISEGRYHALGILLGYNYFFRNR